MRELENWRGLALIKEKKKRKYLHADNIGNLFSNNKVKNANNKKNDSNISIRIIKMKINTVFFVNTCL